MRKYHMLLSPHTKTAADSSTFTELDATLGYHHKRGINSKIKLIENE